MCIFHEKIVYDLGNVETTYARRYWNIYEI